MIERTPIAQALAAPPPEGGRPITVCGWVRSRRDSKAGFSFVDLADGSSLAGIQAVVPAAIAGYAELLRTVTTGAAVRIVGRLVATPGRPQPAEIQAERVEVLGACDPAAFPIQKQKTSLEFLRSIPHLRGRTRTFQAVMRLRSALSFAVHRFFQDRGFTYLHTPIITASDCEGAGQMFRVTTLPPGQADLASDFFGRAAWLTVSGQLEGETYACGMGDIYTFGPTFRAENSNTPRHLAEFWMIEPEMAFCDLDGDAACATAFVTATVREALDRCDPELAFLEGQTPGLRQRLAAIVEAGFERMTYTEAVSRLQRHGRHADWGEDLGTENEKALVDEICQRPVVVTDYPAAIKSFYMRANDDGRTVAAMDVLVPGMGELIGGSQREERLDRLEARLRDLRLDPAAYRSYLDLRRYGTVPHAGFGLGFERLVCLVAGLANIRDAIPYPRTPGSCP